MVKVSVLVLGECSQLHAKHSKAKRINLALA